MSLAGLKYFLTKPGGWFFLLSSRGLLNWMDDETYIRRVYRYALGCEPDFEHPRNFNEKLNWMKLHDRNPLYTTMADKYAVKQFVSERLGPEYSTARRRKQSSPGRCAATITGRTGNGLTGTSSPE